MNTQKLTNQPIFITGGAGFIGGHLSRTLSRDAEIIVLDDFSTGAPANIPNQTQTIAADISKRDVISKLDTNDTIIFHQAGLVSVSKSIETPYKSHTTNATGTLNILDAARQNDSRVVVASSAAIYGDPEYLPIDENHPFDPASPYGLDKLTADYYTRLYSDLYGLETVCLRYFNVFGPKQTVGDYASVIPIFIKQALSGEDITVHGNGEQTRDFVYVDDVVQANIAAAQTQHVGEAYNIGAGESTSIRNIAEIIQNLTDTDSDIVHVESREGDIDHSIADISKAENHLGYKPKTSLEDGLKRTINWWKKYRN